MEPKEPLSKISRGFKRFIFLTLVTTFLLGCGGITTQGQQEITPEPIQTKMPSEKELLQQCQTVEGIDLDALVRTKNNAFGFETSEMNNQTWAPATGVLLVRTGETIINHAGQAVTPAAQLYEVSEKIPDNWEQQRIDYWYLVTDLEPACGLR